MQPCQIILSNEVDKFLSSLPVKTRDKIVRNINIVTSGKRDNNLFKKLENTDIWEFRTIFAGVKYRILAFWDTRKGALILTTHGFIKKSEKVPRKEIKKAERIRKIYFNQNI